jgi:dipeptidyl aminopeptidase/acylaminoacyl peptidase
MTPAAARPDQPGALPAQVAAGAATAYDDVQMAGGKVWWIESRPGRGDVLFSWTAAQGAREALPAGSEAGTSVYGYGGGAYLASGSGVWFSNSRDQRLWRASAGNVVPVTPPGSARYADLRLLPGENLLTCVRERRDHGKVINELIAVPAGRMGQPQVIASGWDFYSSPRPSPDGHALAWLTWQPPHMPWDATWLWLSSLAPDGRTGEPRLIAGGPGESILQPEWSPDGTLHFVSDRNGWWNLYALRGGRITPVLEISAELGAAPWELGYRTYTFLDDGRAAVLVQEGGHHRLAITGPAHGTSHNLPLPYTSIKPYLASQGTRIALIASSPVQQPTVAVVDCGTGHLTEIADGQTVTGPQEVTQPEPFTFPTRDGGTAHGMAYRPSGLTTSQARHGKPPLIVRAHPGPTHNWPMRLDPEVQFFTSRGFTVADIDYRGSTGYGRAYRLALDGQWGITDAGDCADAARHLTATGLAGRGKIVISGTSAGGYTALCALADSGDFAAATVRYTVADPLTWRRAAPKFQAHHCDDLIGELPQHAQRYHDRSILEHPSRIQQPVLIIHGDRDTITPISQAQSLASTLATRATLLIFTGEGHGLREPAHIQRALEHELAHYREAASA